MPARDRKGSPVFFSPLFHAGRRVDTAVGIPFGHDPRFGPVREDSQNAHISGTVDERPTREHRVIEMRRDDDDAHWLTLKPTPTAGTAGAERLSVRGLRLCGETRCATPLCPGGREVRVVPGGFPASRLVAAFLPRAPHSRGCGVEEPREGPSPGEGPLARRP